MSSTSARLDSQSATPRIESIQPKSLSGSIRWEQVTHAVRKGDAGQFQVLFDHFFQIVFREAKRLTARDEATCLDIVQETMLKVIRHIKVIDNEPQLATWIRAVARTTTYDWLQKEIKRNPTRTLYDEDVTENSNQPDSIDISLDSRARLVWIEQQLHDLPLDTRRMIHLKYRMGWSLQKIGNRFGLKTGAVDGRIRRAIEQLKKHAERDFADE